MINIENQNWGLNFIRYFKENNEMLICSLVPSLKDKIISQYGHLINLKIRYKSYFSFKPYFWKGQIKYDDSFFKIGFS